MMIITSWLSLTNDWGYTTVRSSRPSCRKYSLHLVQFSMTRGLSGQREKDEDGAGGEVNWVLDNVLITWKQVPWRISSHILSEGRVRLDDEGRGDVVEGDHSYQALHQWQGWHYSITLLYCSCLVNYQPPTTHYRDHPPKPSRTFFTKSVRQTLWWVVMTTDTGTQLIFCFSYLKYLSLLP